jgi:hypothetical protein
MSFEKRCELVSPDTNHQYYFPIEAEPNTKLRYLFDYFT